MIARSLAIAALLAAQARGQSGVSEGAILLAQVKRVMARHLEGVPNYTCQQTVERYQQRRGAARESLIDVLRLEVAFVGGKELFAWPGSSRFEDQEIRDVVTTGAFGSGDFVLHARGVFLAEGVQFSDLGEESFEGVAARKFSYFKPLFRSGYQIANHDRGQRAEVAYRGFFWVEKESLNLMRLTVEALDIPIALQVEAATDVLDYRMVPLGGRGALLPRNSELRMTDTRGVTSINRMRLTRCKLFQGESNISFEEIASEDKAEAKPLETMLLPAGLEVALSLENEVAHGETAVGDRITARLKSDVRRGKEILLPRGALARGRVIELTRHDNPVSFTVSFLFEELEGNGKLVPLRLRLLRTEPQSNPPELEANRGSGTIYTEYPLPARGGFTWFKPALRLGRGFVTIWETQSSKQ